MGNAELSRSEICGADFKVTTELPSTNNFSGKKPGASTVTGIGSFPMVNSKSHDLGISPGSNEDLSS
jgi:hypothetical protein